MKTYWYALIFAFFVASCSSTAPTTTTSSTSKTLVFSENTPAKLTGKYTKSREYTYLLEKDASGEEAGRYTFKVQVFEEGKNHGTMKTIYNTYLLVRKEGDLYRVQIRYATKPTDYAWKPFPNAYIETAFDLKNRAVSYSQVGKGVENLKPQGKGGEKKIGAEKLTSQEAVEWGVKYYIENYAHTFVLK